MQRGKLLLITACFIAGVGAAVGVRLMPMHEEHGSGGADHTTHLPTPPQVEVNLIEQPLHTLQDEATSLAALLPGQERMLVNFWATWCAPCVHEMPLLQQAAAEHGVPTIGISFEDTATIKEFLARLPVSYGVYQSSFDIFYFFQQHGNRGGVLPYTVLIDGSGSVLHYKLGEFKSVQEVVEFATATPTHA